MSLSFHEAEALFGTMLDGQMGDNDIRATLITMADRGETAAEIAGAVTAMRARMVRVKAPANAIDVCGTGGDGRHSLNVSTAVALVVAACGVPVAKHGNRAASSKAGAADTLEALGLDITRASAMAEASLADLGIAFLFAPVFHPVLARVAPIRKSLGRRTVFNLLGPLANPAGVTRQLIGVANPSLVHTYVEALAMLGTDRAMVVSGDEGLDELSISGPSKMAGLNLPVAEDKITPQLAGLLTRSPCGLKGDDAAYNAAALMRLLDGEPGAYRDAVLLNAAAALIVAGEARDWRDGAEEAAEVIDKGLAKALLNCWVAF